MSKETEEKENKELSIEECYISLEDEEDNEYEEYKIVSDDELDVEINESKEENIDFKDEYEDETEYSDNKDIENELQNKNTNHRMGKILKIIFFILIVFILLAILDIILVFYYSKGPFFAIPIKTYDDGGTKEYYGIGYKVIKYNQLQGRRDMEIGTYRLKYNATPIEIESLDLSIEFNNNQDKALEKYNKKFMRINGLLKEYSTKNNTIAIGYIDEDGKYSLDIVCKMATDKKELKRLDIFKETTIIGSFSSYSIKKGEKPIIIYMNDCFAEQ